MSEDNHDILVVKSPLKTFPLPQPMKRVILYLIFVLLSLFILLIFLMSTLNKKRNELQK